MSLIRQDLRGLSAMPDTRATSQWWKTYFSSTYGRLYRGPLAEELQTEVEAETLARVFAEADGPVVDVGCGHGRHLTALLKAGVNMVGIDYSADLLRMIKGKGARRTARADMQALPFQDGVLGGATLLFNSFGYFDDDANEGVLREVARTLRPGAALVLDIPNRAGMTATVAEHPAMLQQREGTQIYEAWSVSGERLLAQGFWEHSGVRQDWELSLRMYTPSEMMKLLKRNGFSGAIQIRPLDDFEFIGTDEEVPSPTASLWRRTSNMVITAIR